MIRNMLGLVTLALAVTIATPTFAADTGFVTANTKREISPSGNSSPSQLKFGKTSSSEYQALFKWNINIPEFAEVTRVDLQFQSRKPVWSASMDAINRSWNGGSTWNSLGNGLSGSEIGANIMTIPASSGTGNTSYSVEASELIEAVQLAADDQDSFDGVVFRSTFNNTGITDGLFSYKMKITYNNRLGGDTDLDGDVDFADFLALSRNFEDGPGKTWADGDFTGDGQVLFADFLILSGNFNGGNGEPPPAP